MNKEEGTSEKSKARQARRKGNKREAGQKKKIDERVSDARWVCIFFFQTLGVCQGCGFFFSSRRGVRRERRDRKEDRRESLRE
jgi:hypothetical protein